MKCFYHSSDLDGHCSGAIVNFWNDDIELIPWNYNMEFPRDIITSGEDIWVVDLSLDIKDMEWLDEYANLVWIDHHDTAIKIAGENRFSPRGVRVSGRAACELTWEYLSPDSELPLGVYLLGRYDVWDHEDPCVLPFQYRCRLEETDPRDPAPGFWEDMFRSNMDISGMVHEGELVLRYQEQQNKRYAKSYAFESHLEVDGTVYRAVCLNRGLTNSQVFQSVYQPEEHDLMISFCRSPKDDGVWLCSLYSDKEGIHCGEIAKSLSGGGHKGAAGFQCRELPFAV